MSINSNKKTENVKKVKSKFSLSSSQELNPFKIKNKNKLYINRNSTNAYNSENNLTKVNKMPIDRASQMKKN